MEFSSKVVSQHGAGAVEVAQAYARNGHAPPLRGRSEARFRGGSRRAFRGAGGPCQPLSVMG